MQQLIKGKLDQSSSGLHIEVTESAVGYIKKKDIIPFKPTGKLERLLEAGVKLGCISIAVNVEDFGS